MIVDRNEPFEIWLVWSEKRIEVPANRTALSVLLDAGVAIEPGCLTGGCGECTTEYVDGDMLHLDTCLSERDRERYFCPCVSRARGTLALPL